MSLAEAEWSSLVCGTDLLKLERGRVAGSIDDKSLRWMRHLKWTMALVAQALRLCAWKVRCQSPRPPL